MATDIYKHFAEQNQLLGMKVAQSSTAEHGVVGGGVGGGRDRI